MITKYTSNFLTPPAGKLLTWYAHNKRILPWRTYQKNRYPSAYHVWISEIMLQQTTVKTVIPYFNRFIKYFPTVEDLKMAHLDDILKLWAGLGYYSRARNLYACSQYLTSDKFPQTIKDLEKLPGIGAYTSRAIASIAFNIPTIPLDGNIERIITRLACIEIELPKSRPIIKELSYSLNDDPIAKKDASNFTQALFDLGAMICTPKNPLCLHCPWQKYCRSHKDGIANELPKRSAKKKRPIKYGVVFKLINQKKEIFLQKRPLNGLLGGMDELPGTSWENKEWSYQKALVYAPIKNIKWKKHNRIKHVFTHFTLYLDIYIPHTPLMSFPNIKDGKWRLKEDAIISTILKKTLE